VSSIVTTIVARLRHALADRAARLSARSLDTPSRQTTAAAVIIGIAILLSFIHSQWAGYRDAVQRVERDTRNTAQLLAANAARTFDGIAETLSAVGRLRNDAARGIYRSRDSVFVHLKTLNRGSQVMDEIGWLDAYGVRVASSSQVEPPGVAFPEAEFFAVHRDGRAMTDIHVSAQIMTDDYVWRIPISKRIENLDGSFAGVAVGFVDPEEFTGIYRTLDLGWRHTAVFFRRDGLVLSRTPDGDTFFGRSIAASVLVSAHLPRTPIGTYHAGADADGPARIGSYAAIPRGNGMLAVDVSVSRQDALAEFWRGLVADGLLAGLALAVLSAAALLLVLGLRRREHLQTELAAATRTANGARAEAEKARTTAESANRAKSEFLARMSHELRTPLNAVIGFAQMLELDHPRTLTTRQKEYSHHIHEAGGHLLNLVNEVLDLAGVESGRLSISLERVEVADAIGGVIDIMTPVAVKAAVELAVEPVPAGLKLRADVQRLRQVLINLVGNAIKYNRRGGTVVLSASVLETGRVRITVADTGRGIPLERRADLFEPFHRLGAESTPVEGTGLGLALAKRLMEAMGGTIDYASEPDFGSSFWIDLALDIDEAGVALAPAMVAMARESAVAARGRFTLLYVEDNPINLRLMEHLVASLLPDVSMLSAPTPTLGIDLAQAHRPDVIILDLNLPGMSGHEVLARLRMLPETRDTPVLALTAAAQPRDVSLGLKAGFFRYLTKPIDVKAWLAALDAALGDRQERAQDRAVSDAA